MEITAVAVQTVAANSNVLFTETVIDNSPSIIHRPGSGLVTLRGLTTQCKARFKVSFGGNIAIPTGGTVGAISLALTIEGEPVESTTMIETPAAVEEYSNVFSAIYITVPAGCCLTVGVRNTSTGTIEVANANLIVERVA
jgi:hypothetical protein